MQLPESMRWGEAEEHCHGKETFESLHCTKAVCLFLPDLRIEPSNDHLHCFKEM